MQKSGRGGYRPNSGRPSNWNLKPITVVKLPEPLKQEVLEIAHQLDLLYSNKKIDRNDIETVTISKTELQNIIKAIWSNPNINRQGKDKAVIRKALTILFEHLETNYDRTRYNPRVLDKMDSGEAVRYAMSLL